MDTPLPARAADPRQRALPHQAEPDVFGIDHRSPPIHAQRSKAVAKKSRSTTSSPIFA